MIEELRVGRKPSINKERVQNPQVRFNKRPINRNKRIEKDSLVTFPRNSLYRNSNMSNMLLNNKSLKLIIVRFHRE